LATYRTDCRFYNGYKPCKHKRLCEGCDLFEARGPHIGVISLEALGAVLRSTCLLPAIRRQFPNAVVTWITYPNAVDLLRNHPEIDQIIPFQDRNIPALNHLRFDRLFCVDKSLQAGGLSKSLNADIKLGFSIDDHGSIVPWNHEADYMYRLGLDDQLKFFTNQKPETQLTTESLGLEWKRDEYRLFLTDEEHHRSAQIRKDARTNSKGIIGFNTGCSKLYPYKKFTVERSIEVVRAWRQNFPEWTVFLLGGLEDRERQHQMKQAFSSDSKVVNTPTDEGMRSGAVWIDACDLIFSGDSLGMHIAIARSKPVIAWFGLSCEQEIDLYDRGIKLKSEVSCSPCWKRSCQNEPKCYDQVKVATVIEATKALIDKL
jgi:heptosyltransferase-2